MSITMEEYFTLPLKKASFDVKVNKMDGRGFIYVGSIFLSPYDTPEKKEEEIRRIKANFDIQDDHYLNISNFNSVYC
jgi:hypothetical protein